MKNKIFFIFIIIIFPIILFFGIGFLSYQNTKLKNENILIVNKNQVISNKIDKLIKGGKNLLAYLQDYYIKFYQKKFDLYIIDLWGITEYVNPTNSYVQSISFSKGIDIKYTFKNEEIKKLLQIKRNIEELKKYGVITKYKIGNIKINKKNKLISKGINIYYEVPVSLHPTEDKEKIRNFLSKKDKFYNKIYSKFVFDIINKSIKYGYNKSLEKKENNSK